MMCQPPTMVLEELEEFLVFNNGKGKSTELLESIEPSLENGGFKNKQTLQDSPYLLLNDDGCKSSRLKYLRDEVGNGLINSTGPRTTRKNAGRKKKKTVRKLKSVKGKQNKRSCYSPWEKYFVKFKDPKLHLIPIVLMDGEFSRHCSSPHIHVDLENDLKLRQTPKIILTRLSICQHSKSKDHCSLCSLVPEETVTVETKEDSVQQSKHISKNTVEVGAILYMCNWCDMSFRKPFHLHNHITVAHRRNVCSPERNVDEDYEGDVNRDYKLLPFPCQWCKKSYAQLRGLQRHVSTKHGKSDYFIPTYSQRQESQSDSDNESDICAQVSRNAEARLRAAAGMVDIDVDRAVDSAAVEETVYFLKTSWGPVELRHNTISTGPSFNPNLSNKRSNDSAKRGDTRLPTATFSGTAIKDQVDSAAPTIVKTKSGQLKFYCPLCGRYLKNRRTFTKHVRKFHPSDGLPVRSLKYTRRVNRQRNVDNSKKACLGRPRVCEFASAASAELESSSPRRDVPHGTLAEVDTNARRATRYRTPSPTTDILTQLISPIHSSPDRKSDMQRDRLLSSSRSPSQCNTQDQQKPNSLASKPKKTSVVQTVQQQTNQRQQERNEQIHTVSTKQEASSSENSVFQQKPMNKPSTPDSTSPPRKQSNKTHRKSYVCKSLVSQYKVPSPGKGYECKLCNKVLTSSTVLRLHTRRWHSTLVTCKTCDHAFRDAHALALHRKFHHPKPTVAMFNCEHCGKAVSSKKNLLTHMKRHEGRTYTCTWCGIHFICLSYMRRHQRNLHKDLMERPKLSYCSDCKRYFKNEESLKRHCQTASHRDYLRRVTCDGCGMSFFNKSVLRFHMQAEGVCERTKEKDWILTYCMAIPASDGS